MKASWDAIKTLMAQSTEKLMAKMKELDPSIIPILENKENKPLSPADQRKLAEVRIKAMEDPKIKAAYQQVNQPMAEANEKLNKKMAQLNPALAAGKPGAATAPSGSWAAMTAARQKAMEDPKVKVAFEKAKKAQAEAHELWIAKIKEIDPALAPMLERMEKPQPSLPTTKPSTTPPAEPKK